MFRRGFLQSLGVVVTAALGCPCQPGAASPSTAAGIGGAEHDHLERAARTALAAKLAGDGTGPSAAGTAVLDSRVSTRHNRVTHFYFQQRAGGIEVRGGLVGIHLDSAGDPVATSGRFFSADPAPQGLDNPPVTADEAVELAARHVGVEGGAGGSAGPLPAAAATAATRDPANTQLVLVPAPAGGGGTAAGAAALRPAWEVALAQPEFNHDWVVTVDAVTGGVLDATDRVRRAHYHVVDLPGRDPVSSPRTVVDSPADPAASPFGWHDTDGAEGPEFTDTRGNNALAQDDLDANDLGGFRPDGGAGLEFDHPFDLTRQPEENLAASVAQAFYTVNRMHDILYRYGFDEAAGNYQTNNYGRGGTGGDPVHIDVLDGSGANDASFTLHNDGVPARLTLLPWLVPASVAVGSPPELAGASFRATVADFGGVLAVPLHGKVVQAIDASDAAGPATTDACSEILNPDELAGNIALVDRGECPFTEKVQAVQDAGAVAVIVVNQEGDGLVNMSGESATITIPALLVGRSDGESLRAVLDLGPEVVMSGAWRDAAFDAALVVHEYAHGLSTRLTGGPGRWSCLNELVSAGMGEGWSDWFGLVLTTRGSDRPTDPRGVAEFLHGSGIREFPYTTDLSASPETYRSIRGELNIYEIGEVWCSALWEVFWNLVGARGFDGDLATGSGGNNLAVQLVVDAMKLQPCSPTFTEARDAILLADRINFGGDHQRLIWEAFAKRGIGDGATDDGGDASSTSVTEDFSVPPEFRVELASYAAWAEAAFPPDSPPDLAGPSADPDRDGTPNLAEFHLGSNPLAAGGAGLAAASGAGFLTVHYKRRSDTATLGAVEWTAGGSGWSGHGVRWSVEPAGDGTESVTATLPAEAGAPAPGGVLVRLRVFDAAPQG